MKTLTEKQQRFLDVLFDEAGGDVVRAKELAGYSPNNSTTEIIKAIKVKRKKNKIYAAFNTT